MEDVYILGALRTPIVKKNGPFRQVRPEVLGGAVLQALLAQYQPAHLDGILAGNAVGTGGNITRLMALMAGIDEQVPACTIDMQCASGAAALSLAYAKIASGQGDIWLAGGMESSSLQPLRTYAPQDERYILTPKGNGEYYTAQFAPHDLAPDTMLRGAEQTAQTAGITKQELDTWVLRSHQLAAEAHNKGLLQDIIVPVAGWKTDDGIRPHLSQRLLDRLPRLLGAGTSLTAGSACLINDGAAFALLVSGKYLRTHHLRPQARLIGTAALGGNPAESPRGAQQTADLLLARLGWRYEDLQAIEFNEAFAVIDVLFARQHPRCLACYNRLGGALAYGHPYGASGAVLLTHLLKSLTIAGGGRGILAIAGAGGMGEALAVEMIK